MALQGMTMMTREVVLTVLLAGVLAPCAQAQQAPAPLRFSPAAGVQVTADVQDDGMLAVQVQPAGKRQRLPGAPDADGNARLSAEDLDFDGRPELVARASVGMVNEAVAVYRFDVGRNEFRALRAVTHGHDQCGDLMGLTADAATRTLTASCRSGPMWYTDVYRFNGPQLYLYRGESVLMLGDTLGTALQWEDTANGGPLAVWRSYDPAGKVLESAIGDGLGAPAPGRPLQGLTATVLPARLFLYDRPGASSTQRYLVQGDRVEMLDEQDGWLQVRYRTPKQGAVLGWINVND